MKDVVQKILRESSIVIENLALIKLHEDGKFVTEVGNVIFNDGPLSLSFDNFSLFILFLDLFFGVSWFKLIEPVEAEIIIWGIDFT